jgi:hypothetical protein
MPAQRKPKSKPAAKKAVPQKAPAKAKPAAKKPLVRKAKPARKPVVAPKPAVAIKPRKVPELYRKLEAAEHEHQDPRGVQGVIQDRSGHGKAQHSGIPPAPRNNRIVNWFRRGQGR